MRSTPRGTRAAEFRATSTGMARPEEIVEEDGVAMAGPAGAPASDDTVEEQRERDRPGEPD